MLYYTLYIYGRIYFTATKKNRKLTFVFGYLWGLFVLWWGLFVHSESIQRSTVTIINGGTIWIAIYTDQDILHFFGTFFPFLSMHWNSKLYYAEEQYELLIKLYYMYFFIFGTFLSILSGFEAEFGLPLVLSNWVMILLRWFMSNQKY